MPFTYPEDMTMESYRLWRSAKPIPGYDPLRQGGELPPSGHSHDEEDALNIVPVSA
jgi:hypothetical protein